ncbi:MAG: hypothetical protein VYD57_03675 [Pseudomonadota bacterium]|nr:hypothetical protein [Pseudomonadota bacterium]
MKTKLAFVSAALLGAAAFTSTGALAQSSPDVPGSETMIEQNNAAERDAVAAQPGAATDAPTANSTETTIIPGNEAEIEQNDAAERDAVAATPGTPGAGTSGETAEKPLVPGSGADFVEGSAPDSQQSDALQDGAETGQAGQ